MLAAICLHVFRSHVVNVSPVRQAEASPMRSCQLVSPCARIVRGINGRVARSFLLKNVSRSGFVPEAPWQCRPAAGVRRADKGACLHATLAPGERVPSSVFWGPQETEGDSLDIILGSSQENIRQMTTIALFGFKKAFGVSNNEWKYMSKFRLNTSFPCSTYHHLSPT